MKKGSFTFKGRPMLNDKGHNDTIPLFSEDENVDIANCLAMTLRFNCDWLHHRRPLNQATILCDMYLDGLKAGMSVNKSVLNSGITRKELSYMKKTFKTDLMRLVTEKDKHPIGMLKSYRPSSDCSDIIALVISQPYVATIGPHRGQIVWKVFVDGKVIQAVQLKSVNKAFD
jgi:hypothetical protein